MIKSMTGFGRGEHRDGKRNYYVEVRSVNHRYCDISIKMSRKYSFAEEKIKNIARKIVKRGKLEILINVDSEAEEDFQVGINGVIARQYLESLRELKNTLHLDGEISVSYIAALPDVLKVTANDLDEEEIMDGIIAALDNALESYDAMRVLEGRKLAEDLFYRNDKVREKLKFIEEAVPELNRNYVEKLKERIKELTEDTVEISEDRILLEAAVFADKSDVAEEVVRLYSHMDQMDGTLKSDKPVGKKLDFLMQEMNREANTIGSKVSDLDITAAVLEIKSEVEKMREQVQNIE